MRGNMEDHEDVLMLGGRHTYYCNINYLLINIIILHKKGKL